MDKSQGVNGVMGEMIKYGVEAAGRKMINVCQVPWRDEEVLVK